MVNEDLTELSILQKLALETEIHSYPYLIILYFRFGG